MSAWDAIVIGGGHNGLVAGTYLARAGARTVVLEARDKVGGAAATDAPWPEAPEIKVTRLSYVMSLMPPRIIDDLELERHGYKLFPMGPAYQAWPDGRSLTLYDDDARRNAEQLARFSKKDAEAMPRWDAWLEGLAAVLGPLLTRTPPKIGSGRPSDLADLLRLAWRYRGLDVRTVGDVTRLMTTSVSDLLDDWFESEEVKATLAINGVIGTWAGPESPGTAYVMAHHSIGDVGDGHLGSWGFPEGGMGAVADAIHRSALANGASVRTGARVERVAGLGRPGHRGRARRRRGAARPGGGHRRPPPHHLPRADRPGRAAGGLRHRLERWRSRSGVVKINLALGELPDFTADPGVEVGEHHTGAIAMALSVGYIEQAFQDAKQGRAATRPFSDGCIPTVFDKTLAPEGVHVMSLFTQWVPHQWSEAPHAGELSVEQLFHMRPAPGYADYRSPIAGLYQASSATHGGGGVCGIPGWQAFRAIQADRRRTKRRR